MQERLQTLSIMKSFNLHNSPMRGTSDMCSPISEMGKLRPVFVNKKLSRFSIFREGKGRKLARHVRAGGMEGDPICCTLKACAFNHPRTPRCLGFTRGWGGDGYAAGFRPTAGALLWRFSEGLGSAHQHPGVPVKCAVKLTGV